MAFVDYLDVLTTVENMIHNVLSGIKTNCEEDLKILKQWETFEVPKVPFPRYTYQEVLDLLQDKYDITLEFGEDIPTEAYRKLGEEFPGYYYIIKWPMSIKPFYIMHDRKNPSLSEGFDLQKGYLELVSGGTRVHDKELLVDNIKKQGLNPESFESHLQAFDYGMPPHAGIGMGIARWLQIICGLEQIKEAVMFPRTPDRLNP
jgi:aspartyl-tRNA synthetase